MIIEGAEGNLDEFTLAFARYCASWQWMDAWDTYVAALNPAHGFMGSMRCGADTGADAALRHALRRRRARGITMWYGSIA